MRYSSNAASPGNIMRDRLIGIVAATVILFASLYFFIINPFLTFHRKNPDFFTSNCPATSSSSFSSSHSPYQAISHTTNLNTTDPNPNTNNLTILRSPCGTTPTTARASSCIFDPTSFIWTHPRCHNAALTAEFLSLRNWSWYADETLTHALTLDDVMTSEYDLVAVTMEYHVHHCLFMWKLLHAQALGPLGKMGVDSYIGNFEHTRHCAGLVLEDEEGGLGMFNTQIRIKYPDCGVE